EIDFTVTEQTQESFNPDAAAVRSEQTMEEVTEDAGGPSGVPGALTNSPPQDGAIGQADRQEQESDQNTASEELNRRRRTVRNYEVDKTISHTRLASGGVRRLSVAVLVDHRQTVNDAGEVVREPFAEEDLSRFTSLVRDAVGYNAQRGDSVNVISAAFSTPPEPEPLPDEPIWQQAWVAAAGKQFLAGVVVLLLAFGILRPVMRELATKGRQAPAAPMPMSQA
ncbi:MAG: flagellar M-ring protein FliF, partial [Anaerolineae bacterium]|nr:flagellar M-ring protein FliF [Anaerolineae bacterium]